MKNIVCIDYKNKPLLQGQDHLKQEVQHTDTELAITKMSHTVNGNISDSDFDYDIKTESHVRAEADCNSGRVRWVNK